MALSHDDRTINIVLVIAMPTQSARFAGEEGLCFAVFFKFNNISVIFVRPIISTSTGPIFTEFAGLVELRPQMNDRKFFFDSSRDVAVATNFLGKIDLQYTPYSSHDIR